MPTDGASKKSVASVGLPQTDDGPIMHDTTLFPFLEDSSPAFQREFRSAVASIRLPAGQILVGEDTTCENLPIVASGSLRVFKSAPGGREITLYRIGTGESCILTAFSILNERPFPAEAWTEEASTVFLIHRAQFRRWMDSIPAFRNYIFSLLQDRLFSALITVSEVAFKRTDLRLMEYLMDRCENGSILPTTHQRLAGEIGTAREVVSRILKDMEKEGLIEAERGQIRVIDADTLRDRIQKISGSM